MQTNTFARPRPRVWIERLEPRTLLSINDYVLAFVGGLNLIDIGPGNERGGIWVMRADGSHKRQITTFATNNFQFSGHGLNLPDDHPSFSPDGKKIVFTSSRHDTSGILREDNFEIYTMDVNGANMKRLTFNNALDTTPVWSPDGSKIAFASTRDGGDFDIWVMNVDGSNPVRLTDFGNDSEVEPAWSPDGTRIAFTRVEFAGVLGLLGAQKDIWVMDANGANKRQLTNLFNEEHDASWSPDGTQLAISSERGQILPKRPFGDTVIISAATGQEVAVPTGGLLTSAGDPAWSPDGSKIAVFKADLPFITSPMVIHTMNPDGSGLLRLGAPGIINVHPAWGRAADSDGDGQPDYLENDNLTFDHAAISGSRQAGAMMGTAIAPADLNHDGFLDVVTGLPGEDIAGLADAGRVAFVRGSAQGPDFSHALFDPLPTSIDAGAFNQRQANGRFGQTLASGDFNGDGFVDLVIGAPGQNRVFVMYGASTPVQQLSAGGGEFGAAFAVGDFNADGRADLAVGSPGEIRFVTPTLAVTAGAVRVYFGSPSGLTTSPQIIDQALLPAADAGGLEGGDRFGAALTAGDVNGDLVADLIIGVPGEDINGVANAGMIHAIAGRSGQTLNLAAAVARDGRNLPAPHAGLQANARFGEVLTTGDFNGDLFKIRDVVVGIPNQDVSGVGDAGLIAVFAGGISTGGAIALPTVAQAIAAAQIGGPAGAGVRLGQTLVSGDFTGDGVADLAVAAPHQTAQGVGLAGVVYLVPGIKNSSSGQTCQFCVNVNPLFGQGGGLALASAQMLTAQSVRSTIGVMDRFGASMIFPSANTLAAGDLDKDGQADLLIGTPERNFGSILDAGQVGIRYGIKVGQSVVTPAVADLPNNGQMTYRLQWTHPDRWRDLETIHLRIVNDEGVLAWIRFTESSNTIELGDPKTGLFSQGGQAGSNKKLRAGDVELDLKRSAVIAASAEAPDVELVLSLKLKPKRNAHTSISYRVEVFASDDHGNSQGFEPAAMLHVGRGVPSALMSAAPRSKELGNGGSAAKLVHLVFSEHATAQEADRSELFDQ